MDNIYSKYEISRSLNGTQVVYLARIGKQKQLVGRATSEAKLKQFMAEQAKKVEEERQAIQIAQNQEPTPSNSKKKIGLWKAGSLVRNKKTSVASAHKSKDNS